MAVNDQDQPAAGPIVIGGVAAVGAPAALKAVAPTNNVYTFSSGYQFHWRNGPIAFRRGGSCVLDAPLKAALLAAGAPMTVA